MYEQMIQKFPSKNGFFIICNTFRIMSSEVFESNEELFSQNLNSTEYNPYLKIHPLLKCPGFDLSGSPVIEDDGYSESDARFEAHVSRGEHEETEQPNGTVDVEEE